MSGSSGSRGLEGMVRAHAPGRVNLIGDHVDYLGGPVLPMAIDLGTTVTALRGGDRIRLRSAQQPGMVDLPLPTAAGSAAASAAGWGSLEPRWGRYVGAVAAELFDAHNREGGTNPVPGLEGVVESTLPVGSGLSSSAALELAVALALGADPGAALDLALLAQRAERRATGVPCGIMDQLASAAGVEGHALLIDCHTLEVMPVPIPDGAEIWVVHSGQARTLEGSEYAERRTACEAAEEHVGPLRSAAAEAWRALSDPTVAARARHAISECARVRDAAAAFAAGDLAAVGRLMVESHRSLSTDFEVSTPVLDALVADLLARQGVFGARLTGAGFGGCVVALCEPGVDLGDAGARSWRVRPAAGASVRVV